VAAAVLRSLLHCWEGGRLDQGCLLLAAMAILVQLTRYDVGRERV